MQLWFAGFLCAHESAPDKLSRLRRSATKSSVACNHKLTYLRSHPKRAALNNKFPLCYGHIKKAPWESKRQLKSADKQLINGDVFIEKTRANAAPKKSAWKQINRNNNSIENESLNGFHARPTRARQRQPVSLYILRGDLKFFCRHIRTRHQMTFPWKDFLLSRHNSILRILCKARRKRSEFCSIRKCHCHGIFSADLMLCFYAFMSLTLRRERNDVLLISIGDIKKFASENFCWKFQKLLKFKI